MRRLLAMAAGLLLMTGAVNAAEWNFYGQARLSTFYEKVDNNIYRGGINNETYAQRLHGNARIGAHIKASEAVSGRFEYGALGGNPNLRLLYGEWHFGAGTLLIGQAYTPFLVVTGQVYNSGDLNLGDTNLGYYGTIYSGRENQIGLKIGGLYLAAVAPETTLDKGANNPTTEVKLPEIHGRYTFRGENWHLQLLGGAGKFDVKEGTAEGSVTSYLAGIAGRVIVGRAYLTGGGWFGQNPGMLIDTYVSPTLSGQANWNGTRVTDNDGSGAHFSAGYIFNKKIKMEGGYGYVQTELNSAGATKNDARAYYLQATITLAPGVFIVPEVGVIDYIQSNELRVNYYGMKWQIDF